MDSRKKLSVSLHDLLYLFLAAFIALTLATAHAISTPAQRSTAAPAGSRTWALLVGVSQYKSPMIASLNSPAADVTAIAAALEDPKLGGVPASHVLVLTNDRATCANIKSAVDTFFKPNVKPGDQVILYLAGHGVAKGIGALAKGYLLPYDVKGLSTQALDASAVNLKQFSDRLAQLPASQFVAFVDACREDPTPGRGVKGNVLTDVVSRQMQIQPDESGRGRHASSVTFFACSVGQRAYEDAGYRHGVFTYWILDAIRQGAVPEQPDGAVDMGRLGTYVTEKVSAWAKSESASGDFEIDQTPQLVTAELPRPVVLMRVKRPFADSPLAPAPPELMVSTYPDDATVTVNGKNVGSGDVNDALATGGQAAVDVTAPGYAPVHKTIGAFPGYAEEVVVNLPPASRGLTAANDPGAQHATVPRVYLRAVDAGLNQNWALASSGYRAAIAANPGFAPAYERLADIERLEGRIGDSVETLIAMNTATPQTAHSLSQLSLGYSLYAFQGQGTASNARSRYAKNGDYDYPKSRQDAGLGAVKAARAAIGVDPRLAEAQRALGFALVATDKNGANETTAQNAFGAAVSLDGADPANHYAVAFGIRSFAQLIHDLGARNNEIRRAVNELKQALQIRPTYYEAHRELGYCYHLLNDRTDAEREYINAAANRGQAIDGTEVAGVNCALAVLAKQDADSAPPNVKQQYEAAAQGYWSDARDFTPDLHQAITILRNVGLGPQIAAYLPEDLRGSINSSEPPSNAPANIAGTRNPIVIIKPQSSAIDLNSTRSPVPSVQVLLNGPANGPYPNSANDHRGVTLGAAGVAVLVCLILVLIALACYLFVKASAALASARKPARAIPDNQIETLRRNRSLLLAAMNGIGDALVATDAAGRITFMNPIAEKMTGWSESEAVGKEIVQVVTMESEKAGGRVDLPVAPVLHNSVRRDLSANLLLKSRDGGKKPVAGQVVPVWDDSGAVTGAALIFGDITERKSARAAVRSSEAHKEAIIDNTIECVVLMDDQGKVIEFNAAAASTFGYSRGEALGKTVAELIIPPSLRERHSRAFRNFMENGQSSIIGQRVEMTGMRKDGVEIPVELAVTLVPNQDPPVFAALLRDISDRKSAEAALVAAKDAAEAESRDKSRFLNNMSDELRTPLNAVIGYSEMLQEEIHERRPDELVPDLKKINDAARHLLVLVNDVLDLARIEAGNMELYPETFDLAEMIEEIETSAHPIAAKNNNRLTITSGINLGSMYSDRLKIHQCILYLVNNACRFAHERDIDLRVARIGTNIQFRILDLSPGIAQDESDQLAEGFASENPKSSGLRFGGHGLGLVIARHLCQMMGGELTGERKAGHSPRYTITLPDKMANPAG